MGTAGSRIGRAARLSLVALVAFFALAPAPAHAAFPGANGKIAYGAGDGTIHSINPDGTGDAKLTNPPQDPYGQYATEDTSPSWSPGGGRITFVRYTTDTYDPDYWDSDVWVMNEDGSGQVDLTPYPFGHHNLGPSWSPDGTKIVLSSDHTPGTREQIYTINADGTGVTRLTNYAYDDYDPSWSPDGTKILFSRLWGGVGYEIWQMNSDGSGQVGLTSNFAEHDDLPDWSPDGSRIVFTATDRAGTSYVTVMNADGSGQVRLTSDASTGSAVWSPDGSKILFTASGLSPAGIYTMNPDGTGQTFLFPGGSPDWQPRPVGSYQHPASASELNASLVPAFRQCGTGGNPSNAKHSAPLAVNSCNPPKPGSVLATVGPSSQGSATVTVNPGDSDPTNGNQANVLIAASLTDIQSTAGGDYNPNPSGADLTAVTRLRFTDKANGYGGLPATATEYDFRVPIDCVSTSDPSIGSTCTANTTANTLVPGLIQEQRQTVVQAFRVRVDDSGANGVRGDSDDRIFMTQGVFVP